MDLIADASRLETGEFMNSNATAAVSVSYDPYDYWEQDLAQRLRLARPEDSVRGMFANGLLDAVRSLAGDEAVSHCLEASGQSRFVDFFNYPISAHLRVVFTGARFLVPKFGSMEEALRQLGRRSAADFMDSAAGKTMMKLLARGDPRRLVDALPSAYRMSLTFGNHKVEWLGPTSGRYILTRNFIPLPSHEGVLRALLETSNARDIRVCGRQTSGLLDGEYEFSWD
jgi:uncharacterized protein (TIGR02265 family)